MPRNRYGDDSVPLLSVQNIPNVLAAIEIGDVLTVVTASGGPIRIFVAPGRGQGPVQGHLVLDREGRQDVIARGGLLQMAELRKQLARQLLTGRQPSTRRRAAGWALAGATAASFIFSMMLLSSVPSLLSMAPYPWSQAGAEQALRPASGPAPFRQDFAQALAQFRAGAAQLAGGYSRVDDPVSLDGPPPMATATTPTAAVAAPLEVSATRPAASAEPDTGADDKQAAIERDRATAPAAGRVSAEGGDATSAPAAEAASPSLSSMDVAGAQQLLATLRDLKTKAENGQAVTSEMLDALPEDIARQLKETGILEREQADIPSPAIEKLPAHALAKAAKDPYGISSVPPANTWAATGGNVIIPLPGGGDIRSPEDMEGFGLEP